MAEAEMNLPDGTEVKISGSPEEIHRLLEMFSESNKKVDRRAARTRRHVNKKSSAPRRDRQSQPDLMKIINEIKTCEESDLIEREILDNPGQVRRVLLPLWACHKYLPEQPALTSGDISKVTRELGVPIQVGNVSTTLSKAASKFVIASQVRKKGTPTRYKISRKGISHVDEALGVPGV